MREDLFALWLDVQGQQKESVASRISNLRRIEQAYGDLDQLDEAGFDALAQELTPGANGSNPSRITIQGDVANGLATLRSALTAYRRYRFEPEPDASQADRIREFVRKHYAEPARQAGRPEFEIVSGDVHKRMGLENAMPAVCAAIESRKFAEFVGATLGDRQGPHRSSTVRYRFAFAAVSKDWAEAELRQRYGEPVVNTDKMAGFQLPDGRQVALQRDVRAKQLWIEDDLSRDAPPVEQIRHYLADQPRHSNLPPRLRHNPPGGAQPRRVAVLNIDNAAMLGAVLNWYEGARTALDREALERLRRLFLEKHPQFRTFTDSGSFRETEDTYNGP